MGDGTAEAIMEDAARWRNAHRSEGKLCKLQGSILVTLRRR